MLKLAVLLLFSFPPPLLAKTPHTGMKPSSSEGLNNRSLCRPQGIAAALSEAVNPGLANFVRNLPTNMPAPLRVKFETLARNYPCLIAK